MLVPPCGSGSLASIDLFHVAPRDFLSTKPARKPKFQRFNCGTRIFPSKLHSFAAGCAKSSITSIPGRGGRFGLGKRPLPKTSVSSLLAAHRTCSITRNAAMRRRRALLVALLLCFGAACAATPAQQSAQGGASLEPLEPPQRALEQLSCDDGASRNRRAEPVEGANYMAAATCGLGGGRTAAAS